MDNIYASLMACCNFMDPLGIRRYAYFANMVMYIYKIDGKMNHILNLLDELPVMMNYWSSQPRHIQV